jgi:hypothetical protein
VWFYLGLVNIVLLVLTTHRDIMLILTERRALSSLLVASDVTNNLGWLWVQDISILGLNLYGPNFKYF